MQKELKHLTHRLKTRQQELDSASERERDRVFALLLKALHEHPEKLRLWTRLLDYARRVGRSDLSCLGDELKSLAKDSPTAAPYLRALVWQVMADHCFDCAKAIRSETASDPWKQASWNYLQASLRLYASLKANNLPRFYEQEAAYLLECALGTAALFLGRTGAPPLFPPEEVQTFRKACHKAGATNWTTHPERWAAKAGQSLPVWLWWAETKSSRKLSTAPTPLWLRVAEKLDPADTATWTAWARYPRHLPAGILNHFAHPTTTARQIYLSPNDTGWLYEVVAGLRARKTPAPAPLRPLARSVIKAAVPQEKTMTLDEWAAWTASRAESRPYDPRVAEWTALQIVSRIALALSNITTLPTDYPVHPANFLVPRSWTKTKDDPLTWERWRTTIGQRGAVVLRRKFRIHDSRFCRVFAAGELLEVDREPVRGLGLLLLGLLRRSFEWPAAWNPSGHQQAWAGIARTLTSTVACSSWTAAIIEACVVLRVRETLLFPKLHDHTATDTRFDPPQIDTIRELRQAINRAAEVLKTYQLSALNHEPRQLVPISLKQLTRPNWLDDFGIA